MSQVEISPGGIGFIRTNAEKQIPGEPASVRDAPRRGWFAKAGMSDGGQKVTVRYPGGITRGKRQARNSA
jgi:hypothetical protein